MNDHNIYPIAPVLAEADNLATMATRLLEAADELEKAQLAAHKDGTTTNTDILEHAKALHHDRAADLRYTIEVYSKRIEPYRNADGRDTRLIAAANAALHYIAAIHGAEVPMAPFDADLTAAALAGALNPYKTPYGREIDNKMAAAISTAKQVSRVERECGCGWRGRLEDCLRCGEVGPLCPECRETTEEAEQEQQAEPVALSLPFFAYDSEVGFEQFATAAEAKQFVQELIDEYRHEAGEGWPEEVENLCWGVVLGTTREVELPDEYSGGNGLADDMKPVDYMLADAAKPPAVAARIRELETQLNSAILARREAQQVAQEAIEARNRAGVEIRRPLLKRIAELEAQQAVAPDDVAKDAARYRWMRQDESEFSSMAPAELDAAIDKAIAAAQKGGDA